MVSTINKIIHAFAPTGKLRASINMGNPVLTGKDPITGNPKGISIDLATQLALKLGVELELVIFDSAAKSVDAVANNQADVGFFAIDPLRGESITFTNPYILIEGSYLVKNDSPLYSNDEVDVEGHTVVVGKNGAYDLFLSRELKHAKIVRADTSPMVVPFFVNGQYDVAAGVRPQLEMDLKSYGNLRMLPGRFMVIKQAMGLQKSRGQEAADFLTSFVEEMKKQNFISDKIIEHEVKGASVAPFYEI